MTNLPVSGDPPMTQAVIAIGSNIDPHIHVPAAVDELASLLGDLQASPFYLTAAIDRPEQPDYWNGVVAGSTSLTRTQMHDRLRAIEASHHRVRGADKWAPRTLDLDIIGWDGWTDDEAADHPFIAHALAALGSGIEGDMPIAWRWGPQP